MKELTLEDIALDEKTAAPVLPPKGFINMLAKSHPNLNPTRVWRSLRHQAVSANDESLLMWPIRALSRKVLPHKVNRKVKNFMWNAVSAPSLRADIAAGQVLQKIPGAKSLFTMKTPVPWGKNITYDIHRPSALAPLAKARDIAEPILVGVGLEKGIRTLTKKRDQMGQHNQMENQDQSLREKVASVMLQLHEKNKEHEKRAQALKFLYRQAELGLSQLPSSHSELETKLASLVNEDLKVLEKALELAGGNMKLGELGNVDTTSHSPVKPAEKFQADILGNEF